MAFEASKEWWIARARSEPDVTIAAGIPDIVIPPSMLLAFRQLLHAQEAMRNKWAEVDDAKKEELWRTLHKRADEAREQLWAWEETQ